jgi:hypothetical protein
MLRPHRETQARPLVPKLAPLDGGNRERQPDDANSVYPASGRLKLPIDTERRICSVYGLPLSG